MEYVYVIGAIFTVLAFAWAIIEFRSNLKFNRMKNTMDTFTPIRKEFHGILDRILNDDDKLIPTPENIALLKDYLGVMERFAVGVHYNVYDIDVITMMSGRILEGQYKRFIKNYIQEGKDKGNIKRTTLDYYEQLITEIRFKRDEEKDAKKRKKEELQVSKKKELQKRKKGECNYERRFTHINKRVGSYRRNFRSGAESGSCFACPFTPVGG